MATSDKSVVVTAGVTRDWCVVEEAVAKVDTDVALAATERGSDMTTHARQ